MSSIEQQMKPDVLKSISRGQKKRLQNKVNRFASKRALEEKGKKVHDELAQQSREKQREAEKRKEAQRQLNEGFMDLDGGNRANGSSKQALDKFDPMG